MSYNQTIEDMICLIHKTLYYADQSLNLEKLVMETNKSGYLF